jgi:hypothetical protein
MGILLRQIFRFFHIGLEIEELPSFRGFLADDFPIPLPEGGVGAELEKK